MTKHRYQGHIVRKRFGQNFLSDPLIIDAIVAAIHPQPGEALVEVGPGLGALTYPICRQVEALTLIELDRDLASRLAHSSELKTKITLYQQDALLFDFAALAQQRGQALRLFGNLPYNISTPLLFHLLPYATSIRDMHFMLQKEVVKRMVAQPGSKAYGRLSIMLQYHCQVMPVLMVPPSAFTPPPAVDSMIVRLVPHRTRPYTVQQLDLLSRITSDAFSQRRKTLRNSLRHLFNDSAFATLSINAGLRAENLTVAQYCQLADWLYAHPLPLLEENNNV